MLDYSVFPSPWLLFLLIAWFQNWELREKSLSAVSHLAEPLLMAVERFEVSIGKKKERSKGQWTFRLSCEILAASAKASVFRGGIVISSGPPQSYNFPETRPKRFEPQE